MYKGKYSNLLPAYLETPSLPNICCNWMYGWWKRATEEGTYLYCRTTPAFSSILSASFFPFLLILLLILIFLWYIIISLIGLLMLVDLLLKKESNEALTMYFAVELGGASLLLDLLQKYNYPHFISFHREQSIYLSLPSYQSLTSCFFSSFLSTTQNV